MGGFVGTVTKEIKDGKETKHYYLFKHLHFSLYHNGEQIIHGNVTADPERVVELLDTDMIIEYSYSASWQHVAASFKDRGKFGMIKHNKELEIHWLSIMNSFVLVLLLTGFLAIVIMRILKSDYNRYSKADAELEVRFIIIIILLYLYLGGRLWMEIGSWRRFSISSPQVIIFCFFGTRNSIRCHYVCHIIALFDGNVIFK
jgi:hypothetical protein